MNNPGHKKPSTKVVNSSSSTSMLVTLSLVAAISSFFIVFTHQITESIILKNQHLAIEKALYSLNPEITSRREFVINDEGIFSAGEGADGIAIYAGYDREDKLMLIALQAEALGYQNIIHLLFGYDPNCQCIRGIQILKMTETPGIGKRIASDEDFLENFKALDTKLNDSGTALEHAVVMIKNGSKTKPWQIEAISGATISSNAVARMINDTGQKLIPLIQSNIYMFENDI